MYPQKAVRFAKLCTHYTHSWPLACPLERPRQLAVPDQPAPRWNVFSRCSQFPWSFCSPLRESLTLKQNSSKYCHGTNLFGQPSLDCKIHFLCRSSCFQMGSSCVVGPPLLDLCRFRDVSFGSLIKNSDEFRYMRKWMRLWPSPEDVWITNSDMFSKPCFPGYFLFNKLSIADHSGPIKAIYHLSPETFSGSQRESCIWRAPLCIALVNLPILTCFVRFQPGWNWLANRFNGRKIMLWFRYIIYYILLRFILMSWREMMTFILLGCFVLPVFACLFQRACPRELEFMAIFCASSNMQPP